MALSDIQGSDFSSGGNSSSSSFGNFGGSTKFGSFGNSSSGSDLTTEELLSIAQAQGGSVATRAMELIHPERSILSTIGQGFKNAFKGFIDTISIPSEVIAGIISPKFTVAEAIKEHKRVSDAIFGDTNLFGGSTPTTMQKIGNFVVRLPIDILGDPLTYFGKLPFATFMPEIDVGAKVIDKLNLGYKLEKTGGVVSQTVTKEGNAVVGYLKNLQRQMTGKTGIESLAANTSLAAQRASLLEKGIIGTEDLLHGEKTLTNTLFDQAGIVKDGADFTEEQFKQLLKKSTEAKLNIDWAKRSVSQILEHNPALTETFLDRGGLKYLGKTLLSAQRIHAVTELIPGMTQLDNLTLPLRQSVGSLFDPALKSLGGGKYMRLPGEVVQFQTQMSNLEGKMAFDTITKLKNVQKSLNLSNLEWNSVYDAVRTSKPPINDARLYSAYLVGKGINDENKTLIEHTIGAFGNIENHIGSIFNFEDTRKILGNGKFASEIGSAKQAGYAEYVLENSDVFNNQLPDINKIIGNHPDITLGKSAEELAKQAEKGLTQDAPKYSEKFIKSINKSKTTQQVSYAIGEEIKSTVENIMSKDVSMVDALKNDDVKKLFDMQSEVGKLTQSPSRTGTMEEFNLTGKKVNDAWTVVDSEDETKTYMRVQADAKTLINQYGFDNLDTNLMTIMANQSLRNQKQLIGQYYMEGLVRGFAKVEGEAGTDNWRPIEHAALDNVAERIKMPLVTKDGQQYVFHPAVAQDFEDMVKGMAKGGTDSEFWKKFDNIQRYWKASVTSIFPMFHGRNAISNVLQNFMDIGLNVFNPHTNIMSTNMIYNDRLADGIAQRMFGTGEDAIKATAEYNTLMSKIMFTDKTGYKWTYGELRRVVKENDIAFTPNIVGMMDVGQDPEKMLSSVFGVGKTKVGKVKDALSLTNVDTNIATKSGRALGRTIEEHARLVNFITNLNATGDVLHAATRTKMFLFDYQNLTKFEKNTMRRLIPFYTWTRKNLELQANVLLTAPGRISNELTAINSIGDLFGGSQLTDKEKSLLPSWMANTIALKRQGKNGNTEILSGFGTPIEQPFQAFQPNNILGSISPLFRYPVELMSGYQFFQGKPTSQVIDAQNFDNAPKVIKDFIGYGKYEGTTKDGKKFSKSYSLNPANMQLLNNLPFAGRIGNVLGQLTNADTSADSKLLQSITGVNVRSYNFEQLQAQQTALLTAQIEQMMTDAGVSGQFKRFYLRKNTQQVQ